MRRRIVLLSLAGMLLVGCAKDEVTEKAEAGSNEQPVLEIEVAEANENDMATDEVNLDIIALEDVLTLEGTPIEFTTEENAYTSAIGSDSAEMASLVIDIDNDGLDEAFVAVGYDDGEMLGIWSDESYWYTEALWFVDSDLNATELEDFENTDVSMTQYFKEIDGVKYIALNYQEGATPYGIVFLSDNGTLTPATGDAWNFGGKYFGQGNELISVLHMYNAEIEVAKGEKVRDGLELEGTNFPIKFAIDGSTATAYKSEELTIDAINEIAEFSEENYLTSAAAVQYLYYPENGNLNVYFAVEGDDVIDFYTSMYMLTDNQWEYVGTITGFYEEESCQWEFLDSQVK